MLPRSDAHDLADQTFSKKLADRLEQSAGRQTFAHLVIFADPKTLGRLRQYMSKGLSAGIAGKVNRDVVSLPPDSLEQHVRAKLGWPD